MSIRLPIKQEGSHFAFSTQLDDLAFGFEFRWNDREEAWFMSVKDGEGESIVDGVKVVVNIPLLNFFTDPRLPIGVLMALDTAGNNQDAGFADLGRRVVVSYAPASEFFA